MEENGGKMEKEILKKITKEMMIGEVVEKYPSVIEVLLSYGVHCVGCHVSFFESLEQGMKGHARLSDKELEVAIKEMNEAMEEEDLS